VNPMFERLAFFVSAFALALMVGNASAQELATGTSSIKVQRAQTWMSPEIEKAWSDGFLGQNVVVGVIDDFTSRNVFSGNLGRGQQWATHGGWTSGMVAMIAPKARVSRQDFSSQNAFRLTLGRLNVLNLSYGMFAPDGYAIEQVGWDRLETSIINYARTGKAIVVKAAGNDGVAIGEGSTHGEKDYLNTALIGTRTTIFAGALDRNGTVTAPAAMAWYSNVAGNNPVVQERFLAVGVTGERTGLYGTSFAAPVISGYAAVVGSKFSRATPAQISDRLLNTARTDTISGYNPAIHGKGEASIARALAPAAIK
jgi:hypothetical protein